MLFAALFLFILALVLLWLSSRQRKQAGLPGGRIIYTDTRAWGEVEKPFYDAQLGLTGKPDYLVEKDGQIIPVEVKSGKGTGRPLRFAHLPDRRLLSACRTGDGKAPAVRNYPLQRPRFRSGLHP